MADFRRARWGLRRTFQTEQAIDEPVRVRQRRDGPRALGRRRSSRRQDVLDAIAFVGLETSRRRRRSAVLGARERRLVEVARAVVGSPRVVLLDEPAAGLPDEETEHLGEVIRTIPEQFGALVILVDHDMSLVSACCETTAVLDFGKLIASGPTGRGAAERARDQRLPRHRGGAVSERRIAQRRHRARGSEPLSVDGCPCRAPDDCRARGLARDPARRGDHAARPERRRQVDARARGRRRPAAERRPVLLGDTDLTRRRPERIRAAGVAVVPEGRRLLPDLTVEDNLRVATYALSRASDARTASPTRSSCSRELESALEAAGALALGRRAADGRARAGARLAAEDRSLVDELSLGLAPDRRQEPRPDDRVGRGRRASACSSSSSSPTSRSAWRTRRTSSRAAGSATTGTAEELQAAARRPPHPRTSRAPRLGGGGAEDD